MARLLVDRRECPRHCHLLPVVALTGTPLAARCPSCGPGRRRSFVPVLSVPGRLNNAPGEIRHFHTCQADPYVEGRWYVSSGDATHECGLWISDDDGRSWRRLFPVVDDARDITVNDLQRLMRFTAFAITPDRLIWPTDDNVNGGTAALVQLRKEG